MPPQYSQESQSILKMAEKLLSEHCSKMSSEWEVINQHLQKYCDHGTLADAIAIIQTAISMMDEA